MRLEYMDVHDVQKIPKNFIELKSRGPIARKNAQDRFPVRFLEASPRLELGVRILQTLALPLGYDAVILERVLSWIWHPLFPANISYWSGYYRGYGIHVHPISILRCCGAGDGIRTRDFHLGKVTLYH